MIFCFKVFMDLISSIFLYQIIVFGFSSQDISRLTIFCLKMRASQKSSEAAG